MSTDAEKLLASIDSLPPDIRLEVEVEILNRIAKRSEQDEQASDCGPYYQLLPPDEWVASFRAWLEGRKLRNPNVDTSRESIYEGRGR